MTIHYHQKALPPFWKFKYVSHELWHSNKFCKHSVAWYIEVVAACRVYMLHNIQWFISCLTLLITTEIVTLKHSLQSAYNHACYIMYLVLQWLFSYISNTFGCYWYCGNIMLFAGCMLHNVPCSPAVIILYNSFSCYWDCNATQLQNTCYIAS